MIGLVKSILNWYENIAFEENGYEKPDPTAPITLNRLWTLCKEYLNGSQRVKSEWWQAQKSYEKSAYNRHNSKIISFFVNLDILMIQLASFPIIWLISGLGFQYVFRYVVPATINLSENIFQKLIGLLGAIGGVTMSYPMWLFSGHDREFMSYAKAGANIGYELGGIVGKGLGFLANIVLMPIAFVVGTTISSIAISLPIGVLTSIVAPLQLTKTIYNYIEAMFQEEMSKNDNTMQPTIDNSPSVMPEPFEHNEDMEQQQTTLLWSPIQNNKTIHTHHKYELDGSDVTNQGSLHLPPP